MITPFEEEVGRNESYHKIREPFISIRVEKDNKNKEACEELLVQGNHH